MEEEGLRAEGLKEHLYKAGASVVGFAEVGLALEGQIAHLRRAVSIGVDRKLNEDTVERLVKLEKRAALWLKKSGYRYLVIPPDSDRRGGTYVSKLYGLFSHKVAATCSGLGWIGRNGLLINERYGPRLTFGTVLTDAPLAIDAPVDKCLCGDCRLCVMHCPSTAITGEEWSRAKPFPRLIDHDRCRTYKKGSKRTGGKPNCGLCVNICPYGRKTPQPTGQGRQRSESKDTEE